MTNPKGTKEESRAVTWFRENGWPFARRLVKAGARDEGDISLGDGYPVTIESKAVKALDLAGWMKELEAEVANGGNEWGFVIVKKRGTQDAGEYYCVLPLKYVNMLLHQLYVRRVIRRRR